MNTNLPANETERLRSLRSYRIRETDSDHFLDTIVGLASTLCDTPAAFVSLVEEDHIEFKSSTGFVPKKVPRSSSFCEAVVSRRESFIIQDASKDERFRDNPLVGSEPFFRFYAGVPLQSNDGFVLGTLSVLDTRSRNLTDTQLEYLRQLSALVTIRMETGKELNAVRRALDVTKDAAEEAERVKSSFLANMSHEIRTPMNGIIGMTDLLAGSVLTDEQREYLNVIRMSGESLLMVIDGILDFSRIESGKLELEHEPFELRSCIEETMDLVSINASQRGDEIVYAFDAGVPQRIVGDERRLRQVLVNVMRNAVKFTENGEIVLSVRKQSQLGDECELLFSVKDTGIGIPKDKLESIFEAFTQADSSATRKYGGTGLGLVICSRLVGLMGGKIWAESKEGSGARFFFTIKTKAAPGMTPPTKTIDELSGKEILIVDDNDTNLQILSEECRRWGMVPRVTSSPREALGIVEATPSLSLAIFDMQMPEMDGVELAKNVRSKRDSQSLPIILLSSWDVNDRRIKDYRDLFRATVMKPLKMSEVLLLLKSIVGKPANIALVEPAIGKRLAAEVPVSIMVAEDNVINQKLIQRMLRSMGFEPVIVGSGVEVLESLDRAMVDLIFMDVQMPDLDGLETTQKIRALYGTTNKPKIVAMTAFALSGDKEKCLNAGMDDYLSKPFVSDQIVGMIRKWCGSESSTGSGRAEPASVSGPAVDSDIHNRLTQLEEETEPAFVKEIVSIFLEESPVTMQQLKVALRSGELKSVEQYAHKLKGGSLNLGAKKLSRLFERLEEMARNNTMSSPDALMLEIDAEFENDFRFFRKVVAEP